MKTFKSIIAGALIGTAFFFIPFIILRVLLFALVIGALIRIFGRGRLGRGFGWNNQLGFMNTIRSMSDEEYNHFKQNFQHNCGWERTKNAPIPETK